MKTHWTQIEVSGVTEIPGLSGIRVEALPVFKDAHGWFVKTGEKSPARIHVPHGVVHAYHNIGSVPGLVVTVTSLLFKGEGRRDPVDEIRHELNPNSPCRLP